MEAAESSPAAAAECARLLRRYMTHDYHTTPSFQYKAVMLMRILTDNPGPSFTRNMDKKFVETVKELLKGGRDSSVRQILMETLDAFEVARVADDGLAGIVDMWVREKEKARKLYGVRSSPFALTILIATLLSVLCLLASRRACRFGRPTAQTACR